MKKFIQKICSDVVKKYKPDKNVLGILLFGSAARNKFDQYSDIDIYIFLNKKGKFSRSNFIKNGIHVDIILDTMKEVKQYLKEDKNNLRRITSHMIAYGKILFQRGKKLERIQAVAKNNLKLTTKYKKNEILMHKYSIDDLWAEIPRDIKNNDYLAFGIDSHLLISNIMELFLKLNGEFLRPPKEMAAVFKKMDRKFSHKLENFYKANNIQSKKKILAGLIKYIYKKSKEPLPSKWVLRN